MLRLSNSVTHSLSLAVGTRDEGMATGSWPSTWRSATRSRSREAPLGPGRRGSCDDRGREWTDAQLPCEVADCLEQRLPLHVLVRSVPPVWTPFARHTPACLATFHATAFRLARVTQATGCRLQAGTRLLAPGCRHQAPNHKRQETPVPPMRACSDAEARPRTSGWGAAGRGLRSPGTPSGPPPPGGETAGPRRWRRLRPAGRRRRCRDPLTVMLKLDTCSWLGPVRHLYVIPVYSCICRMHI